MTENVGFWKTIFVFRNGQVMKERLNIKNFSRARAGEIDDCAIYRIKFDHHWKTTYYLVANDDGILRYVFGSGWTQKYFDSKILWWNGEENAIRSFRDLQKACRQQALSQFLL